MKNDIIIALISFAAGFGGFLLLFKALFLDRIPPADELAPGIVVSLAVLSGTAAVTLIHRMRRRRDGTHERT